MPATPIYPTGGQYQEALQNPALCFKDPVLVRGKPKADSLGLPKPISGNFASVFTIGGADGRQWAVKCFTRYVADLEIRYQGISQTLAVVDKPWRVPFDYVPEGILCRGSWYPILKMEWIDANGLIPFIEAHLWQPPVLADLASKFARMINDLALLRIAHGDLQHGNLLVTPAGGLKLIDYDGMYVPGLDQLGASENGHPNYQSPTRSMSSWGPKLDHFSAWVIYGSLVALTIDPMLWMLLHSEGDEALLFRNDDFLAPRSSRPLVMLSQCTDDRLKALSKVLSSFWTNDVGNIPALDTQAAPLPNTQQSFFTRPQVEGSNATAAENNVSKAISDWMTSIETASPSTVDAANDPSWLLAHMPPVEPFPFDPTQRTLRALSAVVLLALVAIGLLGGTAVLPGIDAGIGNAVLVVLILAVSGVLFLRTSESRAKRDSLTRYKQRHAEVSNAERSASKAERDRRAVDQRERQALEKIGKRANDAHTSEQKELHGAEARLAANLSKLGTRTRSLQSAESAETGNALRALQDQHLVAQLTTASIRSATIQGIGQALKAALVANGITTAADFTGISYGAGSEVLINLRNGRRVHPSGIGAVKAVALETWRREVEARARRTQPTSLPPAQVQAIRLKYAQQRQSLAQEEHRVRAEAAAQQHQIRERWAVAHSAIAVELSETRDRFLQERAQADLRLSKARREARDVTWQQVSAERELSAYRKVTYWRYCACVARG
jgi:hypothetical protein